MFAQDFAPFLYRPEVRAILFSKEPAIQKQGIDIIVKLPEIKMEVKSRKRFYYKKPIDFFIETWSDFTRKVKGWFFTSQADIILYMWWANDGMTKFIDGKVILLKKLRQINDIFHFTNRPEKNAYNNGWLTKGIIITEDDIYIRECFLDIKRDYNEVLKKWFEI
jgi:hypothetical protein